MERLLIALLLVQVASLGCGSVGGLSQEDLKRRAIKRPSDDDEKPAAVRPAPTNAASQVAAETAAPPRQDPASRVADASNASSQTTALTTAANQTLGDKEAPSAPMAAVSADNASLVPIVQPPPQPLSPQERIERSAENLSRVGQAIAAYVKKNGRYPAPAVHDSAGRAVLSWRVALLPYLGHEALYRQFQLEEPWDSSHNRPLAQRIPPAFQSPERFDERTNYVLPIGTSTVFPGGKKSVTPRKIDDGAANTAILLEVDDSAAVVWTRPADFPIDPRQPNRQLGGLRNGSFLAVWADERVTAVSANAPVRKLAAMFTIDAGEPFRADEIQEPIPTDDIVAHDAKSENTTPDRGAITSASASAVLARRDGTVRGPARPRPATAAATPPAEERAPIPDRTEVKRSLRLVQSIFGDRVREATDPKAKSDVALAMLNQAKRVQPGSADEYALQRTAWKIALNSGDYATADQARLALTSAFEVADNALRADAVRKLATAPLTPAQIDELLALSRAAAHHALDQDDFEVAKEMQQIGERLARRIRDTEAVKELGQMGVSIRHLERAYRNISSLLEAVPGGRENPDDNLEVGRYFCFCKGQWERGLIFLTRGSDLRLRRLAAQELSQPTTPDEQIEVADGWWETSLEASKLEQLHLQRHALDWYRQAIDGMPEGLLKTKIQMRVDEFVRENGEFVKE